jgi:hypothetical protein
MKNQMQDILLDKQKVEKQIQFFKDFYLGPDETINSHIKEHFKPTGGSSDILNQRLEQMERELKNHIEMNHILHGEVLKK